MAQETNTDRSPLLPSFPDLVLTLIHHPHCLYLLLFPPPMLFISFSFPFQRAHAWWICLWKQTPSSLPPSPRMTCVSCPSCFVFLPRPSSPPTVLSNRRRSRWLWVNREHHCHTEDFKPWIKWWLTLLRNDFYTLKPEAKCLKVEQGTLSLPHSPHFLVLI